MLQKAAEYIRQLTDKNHTPLKLEEAKDIDETEMEYYTLRTALVSNDSSGLCNGSHTYTYLVVEGGLFGCRGPHV